MRGPRRSDADVRRIERAVVAAIDGQERVVVAFSAGLASLLVAVVARKRTDLRCIVAGVDGSADVVAVRRASDALDYRVDVIYLEAARARKIDDEVAADHPRLSPVQRSELVPLRAVVSEARPIPVIAGLGGIRGSPEVTRVVERAGVRLPLREAFHGRATRERLRSVAVALGLPESWAHVRHRAPADGAGIAGFLRSPGRGGRHPSADDRLPDNQ